MDEPTPFLPMELLKCVASLACANIEELMGPDRRKQLVRARAIAAVLLRQCMVNDKPMSYVQIGRYMARDRTTVRHHVVLYPYNYGRDEEANYILVHTRERFFGS